MKKWNCLFAAVILTLSFLLTGCGGQEKEPVRQASSEELHHVKINVKDYGTIAVELDSSAAPITVENSSVVRSRRSSVPVKGSGISEGLVCVLP